MLLGRDLQTQGLANLQILCARLKKALDKVGFSQNYGYLLVGPYSPIKGL